MGETPLPICYDYVRLHMMKTPGNYILIRIICLERGEKWPEEERVAEENVRKLI